MSVFARRMRMLWAESGLSSAQAAARIGCNPETLREWCRGAKMPRADMLVAACRAFGASADWLLGLKDER